ncbi:MAG: PrpR N-terminal domain-containing protein, partial [Desulfocucumaceae bacterium]
MEKKFKLGVLSPYPEFSELVLRICREFDGVEITVEEKVSTEGVEVAREWEREGLVEAVVARNPLARDLAGRVDLPVSGVEITESDIITALHRARTRYGDPVGFLACGRGPAEYDYELIREILGVSFQVYFYRGDEDLFKCVEAARRDGIKSVTADGPRAVSVARACGINADLVHSGYGSVRQAIASAISMAGIMRDGRHSAGRMESILYSINDGVLALDQDGKVFFCNPVAEKLLGLKPGDVPGRNTGLLHGKEVLKRIYQDGERIRGELVRLETGKELLVNRVKVNTAGGECLVISFQVVSNIRQMEVKIRQKLHAQGLVARYRFSDICGSSRLLL